MLFSTGACWGTKTSPAVLMQVRLMWAPNPVCPLGVCAFSWKERSSNLVRCLCLVWQFSVGFFGSGLAKCCNGTQHVRADRDHLVNARACICKAQCNAIQLLNY